MVGLWGEIDKMKDSAETKTRKVLRKTKSSSAAHFLIVELPFFTLARVPGLMTSTAWHILKWAGSHSSLLTHPSVKVVPTLLILSMGSLCIASPHLGAGYRGRSQDPPRHLDQKIWRCPATWFLTNTQGFWCRLGLRNTICRDSHLIVLEAWSPDDPNSQPKMRHLLVISLSCVTYSKFLSLPGPVAASVKWGQNLFTAVQGTELMILWGLFQL